MLFVTTTSSAEIMRGLQKLGVPFRFCFMLTMSLQLIPITAREAGIIGSAQRARGLPEKNFIDKLKGLVPMFVPMVVSSLSRMETMSMALESRAFGNTKHPTEMTEIRVRPGDLALLDRCYCNPGPLREPELGIPGGLLEPRVAAAAVRRPYESACIGI